MYTKNPSFCHDSVQGSLKPKEMCCACGGGAGGGGGEKEKVVEKTEEEKFKDCDTSGNNSLSSSEFS